MNWKQIIQELIAAGMKQTEIAREADLLESQVSELLSGKIKDMYWKKGDSLLRLHADRCGEEAKQAA